MSWWSYVQQTAPEAQQAEIAKAAGVTAPTVSRWSTGKQGIDPKAAATFARSYSRPVLEAFVAAGFLTATEAKARPASMPALDSLTDEDLLAEIRRRLAERNGDHGNAAPKKRAEVSSAEEEELQALKKRAQESVAEVGPIDPVRHALPPSVTRKGQR